MNELIEVAPKVLLQLCRLSRLPLCLMKDREDSEYNSDMLEEGSYQLVFGSPANADYQVQKLISSLEHFRDFWRAYPDVNSCRGQSCKVKWLVHNSIFINSLKLI